MVLFTTYSFTALKSGVFLLRESSFNITRMGGGGDEDIEGGLRKFLDTRKGGSERIRWSSENLYTSEPTGEGGLLKN